MNTETLGLDVQSNRSALPASFAEQSLWISDQLNPQTSGFSLSRAVRIFGNLDVKTLEQSISEIVRRQETLRTTFRLVDGYPMRSITPAQEITLATTDLRKVDPNERARHERRLITAEALTPFDLSTGPLMRVKLLRTDETEHVLITVLHRIICDNWSHEVFMRELIAAYEAFRHHRQPELPQLQIQYSEFAQWQRECLQGEALEAHLKYWRSQLVDLAGAELPTDYPRPPVQSFSGATESFELSPEQADHLKDCASREHATLYMTLLTVFEVLLMRYCQREDVIVGTTVANRGRPETQSLIGCFANTLVLKTKLDGDPTFREALRRVRHTVLGALKHQDLPFDRLVKECVPERNDGRNSFFQVMFEVENANSKAWTMDELKLVPIEIENRSARFDLTVELVVWTDAIRGSLNYNVDLFKSSTMQRIAGHFRMLLEAAMVSPDARISELLLLTPAEREQLLVEWNNTRRLYPTDICLHQLIEAQVDRAPDSTAVLCEDGFLTYREVNRRANQVANYLRKLGVMPDMIVGVFAERSLEMVIGLLAALKAGGAYLPLDPDYPRERLAFMLEEAQPSVVLVQRHLASRLPRQAGKIIFLEENFAAESDANPVNSTCPDNLAYVIYTSGSTGRPKGVMSTHRGICNWMLWLQETYRLTANDRIIQKTPFTFDVSLGEIFWSLAAGSQLVLARAGLHGDSRYLIKTICENSITTIHFVPSMLSAFLEDKDAARCSCLRTVICIGEALPVELQERFFSVLPGAELHNLYGPTEATVVVTYWKCRPGSGECSVPIGCPVANTQLYILDRAMQPVPIGAVGELYIAGVQVARGYFGRPSLTAEKFVPNPFGNGRLYKTGDLVRYRGNGAIEFLGRMDHQVKLRGFRIELGEIEAVLKGHAAVRQCVVLMREYKNEADKRLVAYVVANSVTPEELRRHLQQTLPEYMVPSAFVLLEKMPLTANGKLDRRALPEAAPQREWFVEPRTPLQRKIAEIWESVLGIEGIGAEDNFFNLGGHSLLALRLVNRMTELTGKPLPLSLIFQAQTLTRLAKIVEKDYLTDYPLGEDSPGKHATGLKDLKNGANATASIPRQRRIKEAEVQVFPTSFGQQRLWFIDQVESHSPVYNLPAAIRILGNLNVQALERSFSELVRRHEILRTTFRVIDGLPMQVIARPREVTLPIIDLRALGSAERIREERRLVDEEAWTPFDLTSGPVMRLRLLRVHDQAHVLVTNLHHIVSDDWSNDVFMYELVTAYEAFVTGREPDLPELSIQYADFARWQRDSLQEDGMEEQLGYRRKKLAELPVLKLPTDHPRPRLRTFSGATQPIELPTDLANGLRALSQHEGTTLFMTLLTAFKILLVRYTNQEDIVVGSPITNRTRSETENLIGFFMNMVVLRTAFTGDPTFREAMSLVYKTALGAFEHQEVPFDVVVQAVAAERYSNQNPMFNAAFIMLNARSRPVRMHDLSLSPLAIEGRFSEFDITMSLLEGPEDIRGSLCYNSDLFDASTMQRMAGHFRTLISGAVANPHTRISKLPLLSEQEREQIVVEWNRTRTAFPLDASIDELFEKQASERPDAIAVEHETTRWTYGELNQRANQLAHNLRDAGASAGSLVGICLERSAEMIAGMLAILKTGGAYVPIDPAYPAKRRSLMLEGVAFLLTTKELSRQFANSMTRTVCVDDGCVSYANSGNLPRISDGDSLAYVIYTSGSTGQPKGVAILHRGVNRLVLKTNYITLDVSDVVAQTSNCCFDAATFEIWGALLNGARLVVIDKELALSPLGFVEEIERRRITTIWLTTSLFNLIAQHAPGAFSNLLNVLFGGEAADARSVAAVLKHGAPRRLVNGYGPTETTTFAAYHEIHCLPNSAVTIPIGRPISNTTIYILDAGREPVPIGVVGEIYVGGPGVARGYIAAPELTADRFIPDPFSKEPNARLYKTGDLARWLPTGTIEYLGRIDQQVKIRGFRVEPGEIEVALKQHPTVRDTVVLVRNQGPDDQRLVAYVTGDLLTLSGAALREFLKHQLPEYALPSVVMVLDKLPLNANGKIDRGALPEPIDIPSEKAPVSPRDALEAQLVAIWEKVLRVRPIGITDNFFELGGHSLLAVRIFAHIESKLGKRLPLATLFQRPTIEKLAAALRQEGRTPQSSTLVAIQPRGSRPPFFGVHDGWGEVLFYGELAQCLGEDQPFYGLQAHGLDRCGTGHRSIEAIATYYLEEICKLQTHGPYFLGGWCTGGIIAFEMAQQLREAGEQVGCLVMFDANNPDRPPRHSSIAKRIRLALDETSGQSPKEKLRYVIYRATDRARWEISQLEKASYDLIQWLYRIRQRHAGINNGALLPPKVPVGLILQRAQSDYKPRAYPGRIFVFRAAVSDGYEWADDLGWTELAEGGVEIHAIPGKHATIFQRRYIPVVAEKLDACIRAALSTQPPSEDLQVKA